MTNSFSYSFMATAAMYISIAPATNNGSTIICGTFAFELSVWSMQLTLRWARRAKALSERRPFFLVGDWKTQNAKVTNHPGMVNAAAPQEVLKGLV